MRPQWRSLEILLIETITMDYNHARASSPILVDTKFAVVIDRYLSGRVSARP